MKRFYFLLLITICSVYVKAQISQGGIPYSLKAEIGKSAGRTSLNVKNIVLSAVNNEAELYRSNKISEKCKSCKKLYYGTGIDVHINIINDAQYYNLGEEGKLWVLKVSSESAYGLQFFFNKYKLPEGAQLFIYNEDKSLILGAFTAFNNDGQGRFATQILPGNSATIEYYEPKNVSHPGELEIYKVIHSFTNTYAQNRSGQYGTSSSCNIDINCPDGNDYQDIKGGVCRMSFYDSEFNLGAFCTSSVLNTTSTIRKNVILTAFHCVVPPAPEFQYLDRYKISEMIFEFGYEIADCNNKIAPQALPKTMSGAWMVSKGKLSDYSLLDLGEDIPISYRPVYLGWDKSGNHVGKAIGIHHPKGDVKKIAIDTDPISMARITYTSQDNFVETSGTPLTDWKVTWNKGITQGASSGSPLFDQNERVIGQLRGGASDCENSVFGPDFYGSLASSWSNPDPGYPAMSEILDSNHSGVSSMPSFTPNSWNTQLIVDFTASPTAANINQSIQLTSTVTGASGNVSYAWNFDNGLSQGILTAANPVISYSATGNKSISLTVTDANGSVTKVRNSYLLINSSTFNVSPSIGGCITTGANGIATFTNSVSGGNGPPYDTYLWDFGDGSTSTSSAGIVAHTYIKSGQFTVRLTICDETSCGTVEALNCVTVPSIVDAGSMNANYLVNNLVASSYSNIEIGLNTPVTFVDATTGGGTASKTYSWDFESHFENGSTTESARPNNASTKGAHEVYYGVAGKKEVSLTVVNQSIPDRETKVDVIDVKTGRGSGRCYANMGDATISSTCWSPTSLPVFTVPAITSNCPIAKTEVLYWPTAGQAVVLPANKLDFTSMGVPIPQFPLTADFSFAAYQYDGISYNRIGYKRQRFTIYGPVIADAGPDRQVCLGGTVTLNSNTQNGYLCQWTSTNAPTDYLNSTTIPNPEFLGFQRGTFTYSLQTIDKVSGCMSIKDNVTINVSKPLVNSNSFSLATGTSASLSANVSGGFGGNTYSWSPSTNLVNPNTAIPTFTSTAQGNFIYDVSVTDQLGCVGLAKVNVNVANTPGAVTSVPQAYSRVLVTWVDRSDNETGFLIQRSLNSNSGYSDYVTVGANVTSYEDVNVVAGTNYYYRVSAIIPNQSPVFSDETSINTSSLPPFSEISTTTLWGMYGDIDGDLDLDMLKGTDIYKNQAGIFVLHQNLPSSRSYRFVDFDSDGDLDIYAANNTNFQILRNDNGTFYAISTSITAISPSKDNSSSSSEGKTIDFDNDNDVDILLANQRTSTTTYDQKTFLHENLGSNNVSLRDIGIGTSNTSYSIGSLINIADLNNDGRQDIVMGQVNTTPTGITQIYSNLGPSYTNYFNIAGGVSTATTSCCQIGDLDVGDINNDGKIDILATGFPGKTVILNNTGNLSFQNVNVNNSPVSGRSDATSIKLGDMDADGDLDLLLSGNKIWGTTNPLNEIYRNDNGSFNIFYSPPFKSSFFNWVDVDNDGDLDFTTVGNIVYINNLGTNKYKSNTKPLPPGNLCTSLNGNVLTISWSPGSDLETPSTGLSYNLYIKQNGTFVMSPMADLNTGMRKVVGRGNVDHNKSWTINLPTNTGNIEWGVQSIDNQYIGSPFSSSVTNFATATTLSDAALCGTYASAITFLAPNITGPQACASNLATVIPGGNLNLTAKNSIRLLPGFTAQSGSTFNARVVSGGGTSPCSASPVGRIMSDEVQDIEVNNEAEKLIRIYPNPTKGFVNIEASFPKVKNFVSLQIISVTGSVLLTKDYTDVSEINDQFDITSFSQGIYFVKILDESGVNSWKVLKL